MPPNCNSSHTKVYYSHVLFITYIPAIEKCPCHLRISLMKYKLIVLLNINPWINVFLIFCVTNWEVYTQKFDACLEVKHLRNWVFWVSSWISLIFHETFLFETTNDKWQSIIQMSIWQMFSGIWLLVWVQLRVSFHGFLFSIMAGPHGSVSVLPLSPPLLFQITDPF